jgi:hypothetical protein
MFPTLHARVAPTVPVQPGASCGFSDRWTVPSVRIRSLIRPIAAPGSAENASVRACPDCAGPAHA